MAERLRLGFVGFDQIKPTQLFLRPSAGLSEERHNVYFLDRC